MIVRDRFVHGLAAMGIVMMLVMPFNAAARTIPPGATWAVVENTELDDLTISQGATAMAPGKLLTMIVDGIETQIAPGTYKNVKLVVTDKLNASPVGTSNRGVDNYRAAIYVDETGLSEALSVGDAVSGGTVTPQAAEGITITSTSDNFNGIMVSGPVDYAVKDAVFNFPSKSDGSSVSDFDGFGSVIAAFDNARVTVDNVKVRTEGVARPAFYVHGQADMLVSDSSFEVVGGTLYDGYVNSADTAIMVAPPWVLGITGSARGTNLMGNCATFTIVRTDAKAANWGVLSTDMGSEMVLTVVDSTLTLTGEKDPYCEHYGSGYGTYILGAKEYFYGTTMNVGTYAGIVTNGDALYASSTFEKPLSIYPLEQIPNGTTVTNRMGMTVDGYDVATAKEPAFTGITGQGKKSIINSDAFGWMAHANGSVTITDGTEVNTDNAVFLMKSGDVNMIVSEGAALNAKDGVILQIIDNDDSLVGLDMGRSIDLCFNTEFNEAKGYPGIDYAAPAVTTENRNTYTFTAEAVTLEGDLYNGSGYFGGQAGDLLEVTLGKDATLKGAISATSIIHVDTKGKQNTHFTKEQYYYLGHVANKAYYNGGNDIAVALTDNAVWTVTEESIITSLTVGKKAKVKAPKGATVTMTVDGKKTSIKAGTYTGNIVLSVN
jgi:hypothetical protein